MTHEHGMLSTTPIILLQAKQATLHHSHSNLTLTGGQHLWNNIRDKHPTSFPYINVVIYTGQQLYKKTSLVIYTEVFKASVYCMYQVKLHNRLLVCMKTPELLIEQVTIVVFNTPGAWEYITEILK